MHASVFTVKRKHLNGIFTVTGKFYMILIFSMLIKLLILQAVIIN